MRIEILAFVFLTSLTAFAQGTILRFWWQGTTFQATFDVPAELTAPGSNYASQVLYDSLQVVTPEGATWKYDTSNPDDYADGSTQSNGECDFTIRLVDLSSMTLLWIRGHTPSGYIEEDHFGGSTIIETSTWNARYMNVPEPSTVSLLGLAAVLAAVCHRRQSQSGCVRGPVECALHPSGRLRRCAALATTSGPGAGGIPPTLPARRLSL
jgi:hypothetical protein